MKGTCTCSYDAENGKDIRGIAPTTPEHSNVVDITDTFHRLDLQGTPKSSRHHITKPSCIFDYHPSWTLNMAE